MNARPLFLGLALLATSAAFAERADRNKPMHLEADRVSIDDAKKIQILEGDVVITKGTMLLKASRVEITEDPYGFQKGTATSGKDGLARFRQKREGREEYMEGEGERIVYDSNSEIVELFQRARVKSGDNEVRGDYIKYDALNEKYLVTPGNRTPRVHAILQPKNSGNADEPPAASGQPLELKGAPGIDASDIRP